MNMNMPGSKIEKSLMTPETIGWMFKQNMEKIKENLNSLDKAEKDSLLPLALAIVENISGDYLPTKNISPKVLKGMREFNELAKTVFSRVESEKAGGIRKAS